MQYNKKDRGKWNNLITNLWLDRWSSPVLMLNFMTVKTGYMHALVTLCQVEHKKKFIYLAMM